jgi:ferredoxin
MGSRLVRLLPDQQSFEVAPGELILDAALRQGVKIAHSCRNGTCRTCLHRVIEGDVAQEDAELCLISPEELEQGKRLLCMSVLRSDAVLEKVLPARRRS